MSLTSKRYPRHPPSRALSHGTPTLLLGLPFAVAGTSSSIAGRAIACRHHQHTPASLSPLDLLFDLPHLHIQNEHSRFRPLQARQAPSRQDRSVSWSSVLWITVQLKLNYFFSLYTSFSRQCEIYSISLLTEFAGGKGTPRRKQVKKSGAAAAGDDRKLQAALKKMNVQPVTGVEEVNMFKEDGNVLHFGRPQGEFHRAVLWIKVEQVGDRGSDWTVQDEMVGKGRGS
jgi:hypothetical protein